MVVCTAGLYWHAHAFLWLNIILQHFSAASFFNGNTNYSKQILFAGICVVVATFIILSDSKLYPAFANLMYVFGIILMLSVFVIGKDINGSKSWIPLGGGFNLQPAELM